MAGASLKSRSRGSRSASPQQIAVYTHDMLISLKRLAVQSKQARLAALIEAAAGEAQALVQAKKDNGK